MARNTWYVVPDSDEWIVRPKNADEPAERFTSKAAAIEQAKAIAEQHRPSDVAVQDQGSEFRVEATYD